MKLPMYQVDAFADRVFGGNPAAVCPLETWLPDKVLQAIAAENNLAESAFFVREGSDYRLRWFTPVAEVDLCGHATLASADVLFRILGYEGRVIRFQTRSGILEVERRDEMYAMDFPATVPAECEASPVLIEALGVTPQATLKAFDHVAVLESEQQVRALSPSFARLAELDLRGVIVTARGESADFVSRFFAPKLGINEDPVTGSAHCELTPYWAARLRKTSMRAEQLSARGGTVFCDLRGDRVTLRGRAALYMTAEIHVGQELATTGV
ncbi:MAG: PhzF family phenazine biosynthesis protein [Acidobacteriota bacterium]